MNTLSDRDLNTYRSYQNSVDPTLNPYARNRMIPPPTGLNLINYNQGYIENLRRASLDSSPSRRERLDSFRRDSILPHSLHEQKVALPVIKEKRSGDDSKIGFETSVGPTDLSVGFSTFS